MQVKESVNYSMFKSIEGNRPVNEIHLNRLTDSMEQKLLIAPIIVNEDYQVIDGQHRLEASKRLKLPIRYIVANGYRLQDVHRYNRNSKNWGYQTYVDGYARMGKQAYIDFKKFQETHNFNYSTALLLLGNDSASTSESIKDGSFTITQKERGERIADWIHILDDYIDFATIRPFPHALIHLYKHEDFNFSHFLGKLQNQQSSLVKCTNTSTQVELIESIYNYKSRNKVNLRF